MEKKNIPNLSCVDCHAFNCHYQDSSYPDFCPTTNMPRETYERAMAALKSEEDNRIAVAAACVEYEGYGRRTRVEEVIQFAKKLDDMGLRIYATPDTAEAISRLGIDVIPVKSIREEDNAFKLLESGHIRYVVYTGALYDDSLEDYIALHRRALQLAIPCFTSMDTANSLASIVASRYNQFNTELVDICHMRHSRHTLKFSKMQGTGNDYIFIDNRDGKITFPESLCVSLCERHYGVGGYGIVLIENSTVADASMRIFNRDGSEGMMAGNAIRCVAKYLYDKGQMDVNAGGNSARKRQDQLDSITNMKAKWGKYFDYDLNKNKPKINVDR